MEDKIVKEVRDDLLRRSKVGIKKYGVTLDREDLSLLQWHQHVYEEQLDSVLYTKKIIKMLQDRITLPYIDFINREFPDGVTPNSKECSILYSKYVNDIKNKKDEKT